MVPGVERVMLVLPLFHIYAELILLLGVRMGAELVLHPKFDVDAVARDIEARKITLMCGVPTMYVALFAKLSSGSLDFTSLKHCISGGAPLPVELVEPFVSRTGAPLTDGWGMSETVAAGTFSPRHRPHKPGSCGVALPRVEFKVVDVADPAKTLQPGEKGELCIRGPNVMRSYWKGDPAAQIKTLDGYFRTGDVGYIDDEGFVFIMDRCKDMLLCGGFNVYPRIIEEAIYAHPDVAEVCVIGVPDEYRGQVPKAFVRLKAGVPALTLEQLQAFLVPRVGRHEMVRALEVRQELPKTAVGKLSKRALQEEEAARRTFSNRSASREPR
jgi:long-chain acyl-CoA synthetase